MKNNVKVAIKINNIENCKQIQNILFEQGHYWCDIFKKYKILPIPTKYEPLYITTNHYNDKKELTFARFIPRNNHLHIIYHQLIRKYKLKKLNNKL